jgi:hypothetical protein
MSTIIIAATARVEHEEDLPTLAASWPEFSAAELRRLRFLAYRRRTGRLHPPVPLGAAGARVCAEIAAYLRTPAPLPAPAPWLQQAAAMDRPPSWRAWTAVHLPSAPPTPSP